MERYLMWSGGKDSSASIVICHENGIHLDGVIMSEVMFSHERNISGEDIEHITWVKEVAIPIIEQMGYKVVILKDQEDYLSLFNRIMKNSQIQERNGKAMGFFLSHRCRGNNYLKMRPINKFLKEHKDCEQIVGIAVDEPERLERMNKKGGRRSVLAEFGITEAQTYDICKRYDLLSPIYSKNTRGGCWFCPNSKISEFAELKQEHPELWQELKEMSKTPNLVSQNFKYSLTFAEVEKKVDDYIEKQKMQVRIEI